MFGRLAYKITSGVAATTTAATAGFNAAAAGAAGVVAVAAKSAPSARNFFASTPNQPSEHKAKEASMHQHAADIAKAKIASANNNILNTPFTEIPQYDYDPVDTCLAQELEGLLKTDTQKQHLSTSPTEQAFNILSTKKSLFMNSTHKVVWQRLLVQFIRLALIMPNSPEYAQYQGKLQQYITTNSQLLLLNSADDTNQIIKALSVICTPTANNIRIPKFATAQPELAELMIRIGFYSVPVNVHTVETELTSVCKYLDAVQKSTNQSLSVNTANSCTICKHEDDFDEDFVQIESPKNINPALADDDFCKITTTSTTSQVSTATSIPNSIAETNMIASYTSSASRVISPTISNAVTIATANNTSNHHSPNTPELLDNVDPTLLLTMMNELENNS
jgi:hypothetical protein